MLSPDEMRQACKEVELGPPVDTDGSGEIDIRRPHRTGLKHMEAGEQRWASLDSTVSIVEFSGNSTPSRPICGPT